LKDEDFGLEGQLLLCGLLGTNGLGHFYMPEKYPLIDVANIDVEHVWVFLRVVQWHLDQADVS
jgi:hypothetical protein